MTRTTLARRTAGLSGLIWASALTLAALGANAADWDHSHMQSHARGGATAVVTPEAGEQRTGRVIVAPVQPSLAEVPDAPARISQRQWVQGPLSTGSATNPAPTGSSKSGVGRGGQRHNGTPGAHGAPKGSAPQGHSSGSR